MVGHVEIMYCYLSFFVCKKQQLLYLVTHAHGFVAESLNLDDAVVLEQSPSPIGRGHHRSRSLGDLQLSAATTPIAGPGAVGVGYHTPNSSYLQPTMMSTPLGELESLCRCFSLIVHVHVLVSELFFVSSTMCVSKSVHFPI